MVVVHAIEEMCLQAHSFQHSDIACSAGSPLRDGCYSQRTEPRGFGIVQVAKRTCARIEVVPETADSDVDLEALEHSILQGQGRPALMAFTHVPTNSGAPSQPCHQLQDRELTLLLAIWRFPWRVMCLLHIVGSVCGVFRVQVYSSALPCCLH